MGNCVGVCVGSCVGTAVGCIVGPVVAPSGKGVGADVGADVGAAVGVDVGGVVGRLVGTTMTATIFETVTASPLVGKPSIALTLETMVVDKSDESDAIAAWTASTVEVGLDGVIVATTFTDPSLSSTDTSLLATPGVDFAMTSATFLFMSVLTASDKRL